MTEYCQTSDGLMVSEATFAVEVARLNRGAVWSRIWRALWGLFA